MKSNLDRIINAIKNPKTILLYSMKYKPFRLISDEKFIRLEYYLAMGKRLNLDNLQTYNEKVQWLKIHDRQSKYIQQVDKYEVRKFVSEKIGENYLIPSYGIYNNYNEIDFEDLPNQFVLKPTHTSGDVFICKDKNEIDHKKLKEKVDKWLKREYYWVHREWPYKNVKPRLIAEKYMVDESGKGLKDYKFFCFDGEPKFMFIASNRGIDTRFDFFDLDFNHLPIQQGYPNSDNKLDRPKNFNKMVELAGKLSEEIPHVRVDFYNINGEIYFGELTFHHFSGIVKFHPDKYDKIIGDMIKLPEKLVY